MSKTEQSDKHHKMMVHRKNIESQILMADDAQDLVDLATMFAIYSKHTLTSILGDEAYRKVLQHIDNHKSS